MERNTQFKIEGGWTIDIFFCDHKELTLYVILILFLSISILSQYCSIINCDITFKLTFFPHNCYSIQGVDLIGQKQRQLDAGMLSIQQVDSISGSGRGVGGIGGQMRGGAAGDVGLPRVAEREGERR